MFLEPTATNPYLEKFYAEPKKYALKVGGVVFATWPSRNQCAKTVWSDAMLA